MVAEDAMPPNSEPWPELEDRLGAGEGAGVEIDRIRPRGVLVVVVGAERADFDLRIGVRVEEQAPLEDGLEHGP